MVSKRPSHLTSPATSNAPKAETSPPSKRRRTHDGGDEASLIQQLKSNAQGQQRQTTTQGSSKKNAKDVDGSKVDESRTVVTSGGEVDRTPRPNGASEVVEISSGDTDDEDSQSSSEGGSASDDEEDDQRASRGSSQGQDLRDTSGTGKEEREGAQESEEDEALAEPSFGELARANRPETIDVEAALADPNAPSNTLIQSSSSRALQPPSAASLGTVLTQALKTNDVDLLESCLHMSDIDTIRSTIQRLPSSLASNLLQKLAERLHRRPGRAGNLMIWVQWTLVSHGGYLASQPELMSRLRTLHRVIRERASGLQSLLSLKGKLDMLEAQMQLRKNMQSSVEASSSEDDDDERVIYVEGRDDDNDSDEPQPRQISAAQRGTRQSESKKARTDAADADVDMADAADSDDDESDDMPTTVNGIAAKSDSGDSAGNSDEDLLDTEAEETDADTGSDLDEDEVDHDDLDSADDDE